jgi:hypothetical protein
MANQFAFVNWKPLTQRSKAEDLQIRSHCMKGKNKRPDSRRSKREARRADGGAADKTSPSSSSDGQKPPKTRTKAGKVYGFDDSLWMLRSRNWSTLNGKVLPAPAHFNPVIQKLAESASKSPRTLVNDFTVFLRISEVTTVLEALIDFNFPAGRPDLPALDVPMVHGMLLINSATHDHGQQRPFANVSGPILAKTLDLLNQKLTKEDAFRDVSTVFTIAFLAVVAAATGEINALKAHMSGLDKTIKLRGGFGSLDKFPKLQAKIESLDMVLCLSAETDPYWLVYEPPLATEDTLPPVLPDFSTTLGATLSAFLDSLDSRLRLVFRDLWDLNVILNQQFNNKKKVNNKVYHPVMRSASVRLLHIERTLTNPTDMCFCLGMLTYILSLFKMPTKLPTYGYINNRLAEANRKIREFKQLPPPAVVKWLILLSAMSVVDPMEPWLHDTWAGAVKQDVSWDEVLQQAKQILWIDKVHNPLGKAAYTVFTIKRKPS